MVGIGSGLVGLAVFGGPFSLHRRIHTDTHTRNKSGKLNKAALFGFCFGFFLADSPDTADRKIRRDYVGVLHYCVLLHG